MKKYESRKRRAFRFSIFIFLVSSFFYCSAFAKDNLETLTIDTIETAGNRLLERTEVLSKVRSRTGQLFNAGQAADDAKRIAELEAVEYAYYNTAVVNNKVKLTFVVVERNLVRAIVFQGNQKLKAGVLKKKLDFKKADYLDKFLAQAGLEQLLEFYHKKGFAFAEAKLVSEQLKQGRVVYDIKEGPRVKVRKVVFLGNKSIKTSKLKKAVKTKTRRWFVLPGYFNSQVVADDVTKLQKIYVEKGFLNVQVTALPQFSQSNRQVSVSFKIAEGPVYTVDKVIITGNEFFDTETLRAELKLKEGKVYNEQSAQFDVKHILERFREVGFVNAQVSYRRMFTAADKAIAEFMIKQGQRFRIGSVSIIGNVQTHDKVIRRVLDERDFKPGQWYNADIARGDGQGQLEKDIRGIVMTESATITPVGTKPGQKDAQVSIVEGQTGMVMLGAGVDSSSGLIGQLIFEQRNFDIRDKPESLHEFITGQAFKGAGQKLRIALEPGTDISRYSISFTEPYFKDKPISLDVVGSRYLRGQESYDEQRTRAYVGFEKRLANRWRRGIGFRLENAEVKDVDSDAPSEIRSVKGDNFLAGVRLSIARDLTDSRFNPTKGTMINTSYEQVGGDHTFGILSGTYRWYNVIYEDLAEHKTIAAYKLHAATVVGDAPPFEKFYAGGIGSIRGFDYRGVSTRANNADKDPVGSDWIFLANAEVTVPLAKEEFAAIFFIDSGTIDSGGYRASVGTGIQIMIPQWFGPVPMRFELATPLMKDDDDDTQVFSFSVGRLF